MIKQVCTFMENRPGQLVEILALLSGGGINLRALNVAETKDYGVLRFIANDYEKAMALLKDNGYIASAAEVYVFQVDDEIGGLEKTIRAFADDGVDIGYMYSFSTEINKKAGVVIFANNEDVLKESITKNGIRIVTPDELGIK